MVPRSQVQLPVASLPRGWPPGVEGLMRYPSLRLGSAWMVPGLASQSSLQPPTKEPRAQPGSSKEAVQAAARQRTVAATLADCWCVRGRRWRPGCPCAGPTAARQRWAAAYIQFTTGKQGDSARGPADSPSGPAGPARVHRAPGRASPCPQSNSPTKAP